MAPPRLLAAGLVFAGVLACSACAPFAASPSSAQAAPAVAQLDALPVRPHTSLAGYSREAFGPAWSDNGTVELSHNHCPTREDILARDLDRVVRDMDGCTVLAGVLHDRYTGKTVNFQRGPRTSLVVQIDHIVPLGLAWQTGARELTAEQRLNLANDPENLVAADGSTNAAKGAKDASEWLPPRSDALCWYASAQVRVKAKYRLSVSSAEESALRQVLQSCPSSGQGAEGRR
ncbi:HNH endonuclease family protein [Streptomyces sp. XH2]|uniref:HNH endonuclease family protein n=1 Tax=Streptomyces sp. XH2 TaxID=3412483 RepID=UPI003C7E31E8